MSGPAAATADEFAVGHAIKSQRICFCLPAPDAGFDFRKREARLLARRIGQRHGRRRGRHGAALDHDVAAGNRGGQSLLFELRLFHQPMRQAAQQFGFRPAAFEAARPQPALVRQQFRHAALADAVEHQERLVAGPAHHGLARDLFRADQAEPAAPGRRRLVGVGAGQIARHRMGEACGVTRGLKGRATISPLGCAGSTAESGVR